MQVYKILGEMIDYNSQFVDVRMENNKNADNLRKRIEEVEDNFDQIIKIRKESDRAIKAIMTMLWYQFFSDGFIYLWTSDGGELVGHFILGHL